MITRTNWSLKLVFSVVILNFSLLLVKPDSASISLTLPSCTVKDFNLKTESGSDVPSMKGFSAVIVFTFSNVCVCVVYSRVFFAYSFPTKVISLAAATDIGTTEGLHRETETGSPDSRMNFGYKEIVLADTEQERKCRELESPESPVNTSHKRPVVVIAEVPSMKDSLTSISGDHSIPKT
jgi:hypothetical protein